MSAAKHTRTPWESRGQQILADGGLVATVGFRLDAEEQAANVALIEAAPELLEAAQKVEAGWVALCAFLPQHDAIEALEWSEFRALRGAIRKATGSAS